MAGVSNTVNLGCGKVFFKVQVCLFKKVLFQENKR